MIPNQYPSLNFDLGETADLLRDSVRSFASDAIAPIAEEMAGQVGGLGRGGMTLHSHAVLLG